MKQRVPVSSEQIAREFRLQRCRGSAVDAITDPLIARVLEMGARHRALNRGEQPQPRSGKKCAANDE